MPEGPDSITLYRKPLVPFRHETFEMYLHSATMAIIDGVNRTRTTDKTNDFRLAPTKLRWVLVENLNALPDLEFPIRYINKTFGAPRGEAMRRH
jgi:hypothetical protein